MVDTFCTSAAVIMKAGANVNSTASSSGSIISTYINQAECFIVVTCGVNYLDTFSTLNADVKLLLEDVCSSLASMQLISYDMSGYTSRNEAQTMLDVQRDFAERGLALLRLKEHTDFISGA